MRRILHVCLMIAGCMAAQAQPAANPQQSLTFAFTEGGGANGIAVAYSPSKKIYYCGIAGNADFPLEAFLNGKSIYKGKMGFDSRGLWYDEKENALEGNAYEGSGIYSIELDDRGMPEEAAEYEYPGGQPADQCVGVPDRATGEVLYFNLDDGTVTRYKMKTGKKGKSLTLKNCPTDFENINSAMIYTGQKKYEIGLYDFVEAKLYFFDKKGNYTATSTLDTDAPYNESFNFSYANGYVFMFDTDMREWIGYKIF